MSDMTPQQALADLEDLVTVWVVYDTNMDKKYIKKDPRDGALAIFDYDYEARAVSTETAGTSYKKVVLIDPHKLSRLRERVLELEAFRSAVVGWRESDWPAAFCRATAEAIAQHGDANLAREAARLREGAN